VSDKPARDGRACMYALWLEKIIATARTKGYAIGVHGSLQRDLDLLAVPWTEEAASDAELAEAIRETVGGDIAPGASLIDGQWVRQPMPKEMPHGRRVWTISFVKDIFIDLSVMPRGGLKEGVPGERSSPASAGHGAASGTLAPRRA
jgi:hypothetical protein